jgi:hypothetical protein
VLGHALDRVGPLSRRRREEAVLAVPDHLRVFADGLRQGRHAASHVLERLERALGAARGLVEITIEDGAGDLAVRALGSGEEGPVDWGPARTGVFACLDETGKASLSLLATWDFGFLETHLQLRLPGGTLASAGFNVFKDGSGRPSYVTREFFYRD